MSANSVDQRPEERLFRELETLRREVKELRTLQRVGGDVMQVTGYPGVGLSYDTTFTIDANSQKYITLGVRTELLAPTIWEPALAIHVDVDDTNHLWRTGSALTSEQQKLFCSVVRNWEYGQTSQDPENNGVWEIQLWNLGTASHVYYVHVKLFGAAEIAPLTVM